MSPPVLDSHPVEVARIDPVIDRGLSSARLCSADGVAARRNNALLLPDGPGLDRGDLHSDERTDGIAISSSALQAIGCLGMRAGHTNNCPVGIATQKESPRRPLFVAAYSQRLTRYLTATVSLMKVLARACGQARLSDFAPRDLRTHKRDLAHLTGISYAGVSPIPRAP